MDIISKQKAIAAKRLRYFTGVPCSKGHVAERYVKIGSCIACCKEQNRDYLAKRFSNDPGYKKKRVAQSNAWLKAHPEKARKYERDYAAKDPKRRAKQKYKAGKKRDVEHPEKKREHQRLWRLRNPEKEKENRKKFRAANPNWVKNYNRKRRKDDPEKARQAVKAWCLRNPERAIHISRASKTNRRAREKNNGGRVTGTEIALLFAQQRGHCAACAIEDARLEIDHVMPVFLGGSSDLSNLQLLCFPCNRAKGKMHPDEWQKTLKSQ